jgi:GTP pyrophosphokinase
MWKILEYQFFVANFKCPDARTTIMSKEYVIEFLSKKEFLELVLKYNPNANVELIGKAHDFAEKAHKGQKRLCGRDYFLHCKEVANMLVKLRLDTATICAGLLHDVLEDTNKKAEEIKKEFGAEVLYLVNGVTKIRSINLEGMDSGQRVIHSKAVSVHA